MSKMQISIVLTFLSLIMSSSNQQIYSVRSSKTEKATPSEALKPAEGSNQMNCFTNSRGIGDYSPQYEHNVLLGNHLHQSPPIKVIRPQFASCIPELRIVTFINEETDPSLKYFPSCTRIKRCGGCCGHSLLTCEPLSSEYRYFQVSVVVHLNNTHTEKTEIIKVEEHTSCACACKKKIQDCTEKQEYVKDTCRCECLDRNGKENCEQDYVMKIWHPDKCTCQCRKIDICSEGLKFNKKTCRCQLAAISSQVIPFMRIPSDYSITPMRKNEGSGWNSK